MIDAKDVEHTFRTWLDLPRVAETYARTVDG
jgi:hypothetical protein